MDKYLTSSHNQTALDKALIHSRVQPWKAEKENPRDMLEKRPLRAKNGDKSLIGSLISDAEYHPNMEKRPLESLLASFPELTIKNVDLGLLQEIENIDHLWDVKEWERAFRQCAGNYRLKCGWPTSTLHDKLSKVTQQKSGICNLVLEQRPTPEQMAQLWELLKSWPEGTGYWKFPVPAEPGNKDPRAAKKAYVSGQNLWASNPYGDLRRALLTYLLEQTK